MRFLRILSCPRIRFAHAYRANTYQNQLIGWKNIVEVTYIEEGQLIFSNGKESFIARTGDVVCNLFTGKLNVCSEAPHEHRTVSFTFDFEVVITDDKDFPGLYLPLLVTPPDSRSQEKLRDCINSIIRLHIMSPDSPDTETECAGLFLQLLSYVSTFSRATENSGAVGTGLYVRRAMEYIYSHVEKPIRQRDVAASLGITPEYLCTLFKRETGQPMMTYINRMKLERIRTVMVREGLPLSSASELYGFADPNYVSRLYHSLFGTGITEAVKREKRQSSFEK